MIETAVVTTYIDVDIKQKAENILARQGRTMSQELSRYIRQLVSQDSTATDTSDSVAFLRSMSGIFNSGQRDTSSNVNTLVANAILQKHTQNGS